MAINSNEIYNNKIKIITVFAVFLLAYLFACVADKPSFLMGLDRGQYSRVFLAPFMYTKILSWAPIILIPCVVSCIYGKMFFGIIGIILYCLHSFWVGQKFGSFMILLNLFLIIYYYKVSLNKEKIKKIVIIGLNMILALVLFSAFAFSFTSDIGVKNYFAIRMAGQSAMWWGTYTLSNGNLHIGQLANELEGFVYGSLDTFQNVGARYGIYNIMYFCSPKAKVDYDIQFLNTRYTEAGFASAYYILSYIGPIIFAVFCAFVFSIIVNYFIRFLTTNRILEAALIMRIYYLFTVMMSMFTFNQFRSIVVVFILFWLFFLKNIRLKMGISEN